MHKVHTRTPSLTLPLRCAPGLASVQPEIEIEIQCDNQIAKENYSEQAPLRSPAQTDKANP